MMFKGNKNININLHWAAIRYIYLFDPLSFQEALFVSFEYHPKVLHLQFSPLVSSALILTI